MTDDQWLVVGTVGKTLPEKCQSKILQCKTRRLRRIIDSLYKANDLQRRDASDFSDEFSDEIGQMSGRCLDIGSGPGDTVVDFILPKLNKKASLVCSDISEKMVNFGKEKYKDNERLFFVKLNIESTDLPKDLEEQFDHVTSFYCLHWCRDMRLVFANIFNLLRPGGTTLLTFISKCPCLNVYKSLAAMPRYQPYMKDADRYIPVFQHAERRRETLRVLLKDVGFEIRHCSLRDKTYIFKTPEDVEKFMMAMNPFMDRMPAELRKEYTKDLVKEVGKGNIIINKKNEDEYSVLSIYIVFVVYLRKPSNNSY